jgi:hypothetical protein
MPKATVRLNARALPKTDRRAVLRSILAGSAAAATALPATIESATARSSGSEVLTLEQMAGLNFEPWSHAEDEWEPPSNVEWADDAINVLPLVRMTWLSMLKTKAELETLVVALTDEHESFEKMVRGIISMRKYFEHFVTVLSAAECRLMCAASAVDYREGGSGRGGGLNANRQAREKLGLPPGADTRRAVRHVVRQDRAPLIDDRCPGRESWSYSRSTWRSVHGRAAFAA